MAKLSVFTVPITAHVRAYVCGWCFGRYTHHKEMTDDSIFPLFWQKYRDDDEEKGQSSS
jgi:hypothetical protein